MLRTSLLYSGFNKNTGMVRFWCKTEYVENLCDPISIKGIPNLVVHDSVLICTRKRLHISTLNTSLKCPSISHSCVIFLAVSNFSKTLTSYKLNKTSCKYASYRWKLFGHIWWTCFASRRRMGACIVNEIGEQIAHSITFL